MASVQRTRPFTVIAQDPGVRDAAGRIITAQVDIPAERLGPGPWGHRVHVIDFDGEADVLYKPGGEEQPEDVSRDHYAGADNQTLLNDPRFHAQNAYALVMRTVARFEQALGRHVAWGFDSHQLKIVPHAFMDTNAFYSRSDEALLFGWFHGESGRIFSCLCHDVVVHETTHALLDGIRGRFKDPSSHDQAAFHEGFADVVALLSVFSLPGVVHALLPRVPDAPDQVRQGDVQPESLKQSVLLELAEQMGWELSGIRGRALRQSAQLTPSTKYYLVDPEFQPAHRRGEILVAAMMTAFLEVWAGRMAQLGGLAEGLFHRARVIEEGSSAADYLLTMAVRALDYTPPVHLEFPDYLSALITSDVEIHPDDSRYRFRDHLRASFAAYGIEPAKGKYVPTLTDAQRARRGRVGMPEDPSEDAATTGHDEPGAWGPYRGRVLSYRGTHFEPLARDADEVFKFIWENREALRLYEGAFTKVLSVRPCLRIGPDGFVLRETVAEYYQVVRVRRDELAAFEMEFPNDMPAETVVPLYGGGTLIFDEFGRLKFYIHNSLDNAARQSSRIAHLWQAGVFRSPVRAQNTFAELHRRRTLDIETSPQETW